MKLAVHCEPLVNSCTPGWIAAVAAGAQVMAADADPGPNRAMPGIARATTASRCLSALMLLTTTEPPETRGETSRSSGLRSTFRLFPAICGACCRVSRRHAPGNRKPHGPGDH